MLGKLWEIIERIIENFLKIFFRIIHKELSENVKDVFFQFVKFGIVGVSNTVISYLLYVGCLLIFDKLRIWQNFDYIIAQTISFVLSVLWSFYWNNRMVFVVEDGKKRNIWSALVKTYISYSFTGLFLNNLLLVLWVQMMGISEFVAPIINLIVSVPLNFLINKFWAFKSK